MDTANVLQLCGFSMMSQIEAVNVVMLPDGRMDTQNAAHYAGLSVKTMAMKRCDGTGPKFVKLGRVFYFRADLDAWLQRGRVVSTAQASQASRDAERIQEHQTGQRPGGARTGARP